MEEITTHRRSCHLCEAMCGLEIDVKGNHIVAIRGDTADPFSRGYLCPKGIALQDIHHDPDRLRHPVRRTADGWQPIPWEEALDEVADNIVRLQKNYGFDALGTYWGNPIAHSHGAILTMLPFFMSLKTRNRYSASSIDQLPQYVISHFMFGNQLLFPVADIDRTDFLLIIGGNPLVSNGSLSSAPDMRGRLRGIAERGSRIVVVDPRRTETARIADHHHFIRPGTDVLLLLALLHTLFAEQLVDVGTAAGYTDRLPLVAQAVRPYAPEKVAAQTGIDGAEIRQLARDFARAPNAVCYGRLGVSQQPYAGLCHWLINLLNIVTGNFDQPGGVLFPQPAFDLRAVARLVTRGSHYAKWRSRVHALPEFSDELPVTTLADEILTPGNGQIKGMLLLAGNPVLTTPDTARMDAALAQLDFCVAIDFYINETTRHADIILPPSSPLEHSNYEIAVSLVSMRNVARYSSPVFTPPPDARDDWEILVELQARVERRRGWLSRLGAPLKHGLLRALTPDGILNLGLTCGSYGILRRGWRRGLTLSRLKTIPHTVDLGPLQPSMPGTLYTKNKRIDLAPPLILADLERVARDCLATPADSADDLALQLIGRRHLRSNNSWMHNSRRLVKGRDRCTLLMHPDDAARRQLMDGQTVRVQSKVGVVTLPLTISDEMMPGVVSIPHGWGHHFSGTSWRVAEQHAGVSVNTLTDSQRYDPLSGNAAVNGVSVTVSSP